MGKSIHIRKDYSIEIFEIRPHWKDPNMIIEGAVAKNRYIKKNNIWKIFWQRADLKWHSYKPNPEVDELEQFLSKY